MEKSIFRYIIRFSLRPQLILLAITAVSMPFIYFSLDLPKQIINDAIDTEPEEFPTELLGLEFDQIPYLFVLCGIFFGLVVINGGFKYVINVYTGLLGERMLRRLRYDLYSRVLRFPLPVFRKLSQGEIIPMITQEVEPLGGFIGMAISGPAQFGGQLFTILGFLFMQDWVMGLAAVSLYPLQIYIIPRLQKRVNLLAKERVRLVRKLSDRVGETVQGVLEIHVHDTSNFELADISHRLGSIFEIRYRIYKLKFFTKFLNNFLNQLGPFLYYSIGGYLVIEGDLTFGSLIAAITAYKDLAQPWKELLLYYQISQDSVIKYESVTSQFEPSGMREADYQIDDPEGGERLEGELAAANITLTDDQEVNVVDGVSLKFNLDEHVAVVGPSGSGKEELMLLLARLMDPDRGRISVNGQDLGEMVEGITGRRMAFVGQGAYVFSGTLGDNLYYGLKHRPLRPPDDGDDAAAKERERWRFEAQVSGNIEHDIDADWIDYAAAGVEGPESLVGAALAALTMVDMAEDVYQLGLRGAIDPQARPELAEAILSARFALRERLQDPAVAPLIELFDREQYNTNATMAENLLFGTPVGDAFDMEHLAQHPYVLSIMDKVGMTDAVLHVGFQLASTMVEMFADLPPEHELFQQFSFISADELPDVQALLNRVDRERLGELNEEDRMVLLSLPFKLIPARHRLGLMDDEMQRRVLEARQAFADNLTEELQGTVEFFAAETYNAAANLQDNILFGKVAYGQAQAATRVGELIAEVVAELDLRQAVTQVGLDFDVGIAGSRLSGSQRQKLALARAILKRPDVLIISEATAPLDSASQSRILAGLLEEFAGRSLIWSLHRAGPAESFDRVLVMRGGRVVEQGSYAELNKDGSYFKELLAAE
ncbi:MAG: ABC transporter transmembrane domain-containing protein [Alphaproteobacteria bacterium]|nr:ABC transporter transmembrane domain-containing protein [Alphaproteobacteria bacterium]